MCITTYRNNTHLAKFANIGTPGKWVSYADNHTTGTYQVFNTQDKIDYFDPRCDFSTEVIQ